MLPCKLNDGHGSGSTAKVYESGAVAVSVINPLSTEITLEQKTNQKQYSGYLLNGASNSLKVDGSVTPVSFSVQAQEDRDIYVTGARIILHGTGLELDTNDAKGFTNSYTSGLTNGMTFFVSQSGVQTDLFLEPVQTIIDFMRYRNPDTNWVNFVNAISAQSDYLDFGRKFDTPIPLPKGSQDILTMMVNDNLNVSSLDLFQVILDGYQELV